MAQATPTRRRKRRITQNRTSPRVLVRRKRDINAMKLRLAGATFQEIADQLGYSDRSLARRAIMREISLEAGSAPQELRDQQLLRVHGLLRANYMRALQGDFRAAQICLQCLAREAQLCGLDMPVRIEASGPGGGAVKIDFSKATDDDLREVIRQLGGEG